MSYRGRYAVAASALAILASVLTAVTTSAADAAASAGTIKVFISKAHDIHMTSGMHPGLHRFAVRSGGSSAFQLIQARPGYTKHEAARDVNLAFNKNRIPALRRVERNLTFLGGVSSAPGQRGVMYVNLRPGGYWAVDTNQKTTLARRISSFQVGGAPVAGVVHTGNRVRAIRETTWAGRPRSINHAGLLRFTNAAKDNHFVDLAQLQKGKTMKDWRRWIRQVKSGKNVAPPTTNVQLSSGVQSPGHSFVLRYSLPPGRYVLTCFWPDADMGGEPHAFMGMYRGIRLR
jgi:hypothetical protein